MTFTFCGCKFHLDTHYGVIVTLQTNIWFGDTSAVAVFVAAALQGTVVPHKPKVTQADAWRDTCSVQTALCAHWPALTGKTREKNHKGK